MKKRFKIFLATLMIGILSSMSLYVVTDAKSTYVKGYYRKDGTYVKGHYRSAPNNTRSDNWSHCGNKNPYTGEIGTKDCNGTVIITKPVEQPKVPSSPAESTISKPVINEKISDGYIRIGSSKDEVIRILGVPTFSGYNSLRYGYSSIYLDYNGKVSGWSTVGSSKLPVSMGGKKEDSLPFTVGSSKQQVVDAMGTPDTVFSYSFNYGYSSVYFDFEGNVSGWSIFSENPLNATLGEKNLSSPGFTRGSTLKEVIEAMGTPDTVFDSYISYGYSRVYISNGKVSSYSNFGNNLKIKQ